jgi:predicted RNA-binding protein with PIN domain
MQLILYDVIEQLEQTRRTFKSKQIELLRKKLIKVLLEDS